MGRKNKNKKGDDSAEGNTGAEGQQQVAPQSVRPDNQTSSSSQQPGPSQTGNIQQSRQGDETAGVSKKNQKRGKQQGQQEQGGSQQGAQKEQHQQQERQQSEQQQGGYKQDAQKGKQKQQKGQQGQQQRSSQQDPQQQQSGPQQGSQKGAQQQRDSQQQQQQKRDPQQQQRGPQQQQQEQKGPQQQQQRGPQQQQQQQRGPQQQQQPHQQQQRGPQQQQHLQQSGPQQQQQWGPQQQQQEQRGPQQQQQRGPQQQQQQQWGPQQQQQPHQQQQRGPQQQQHLQQSGPQQQQQWGPQQQQQWGPQQQQHQQQQRGPQQQQQWGPQQQQQWGPQQQQHQQQQRGPQQQQQWGPQTQQQQYNQQQQRGPQQQQRGPQQQHLQQSGPQQQQQWGPQQQQQWGPQQQQQWGPQQQQQRGPQQQQQRVPQQQQEQRGPQQQQQRGPQQQQHSQQRGPQQQQQQQQQKTQAALSRASPSSSSSSLSTPSVGSIPRGTKGRPGTVEVNYLNLDLDKMPNVAYHYDISFTPDRPKKFFRSAFEQFNRQYFPNIAMAFDGRASAYTVQKCLETPSFDGEVEIDDSGDRRITFKITIKETQDLEIDLSALRSYFDKRIFDKPMRSLQCLEVVLANPCYNRAVRVGRSFFRKPEQHMDLGNGYEMWTGLYQAVILGDSPFLNVDVSNKSFPSECNLIDFIKNNFNCNPNQPLDDRNCFALKSFLNGVNIKYEPPASMNTISRIYKVFDVSREPANKLYFSLEDGSRQSVADYFASKNYRLQYPTLNCLSCSNIRSIYLPLELCSIPPGQALNRKDDSRQVQQMIKFAATSTNVRKEKIMSMLMYFQHNNDEKLRSFGISVGNAFKSIPMRILQSPSMEYYSRELITPFKGAWRMNTNTQFLLTKKNSNGHQWAIIYHQRGFVKFNVLSRFAGMVSDISNKLGMTLAPKPDIISFDRVETILKELKGKNYDLVFVVIPTRGPTKYSDIKQAAELQIGQLTQCIKENTIERRCDAQTVSNILLKVNGKLNGTNHIINAQTNIPLKNVMFLGADVTHPSPDQKHIPSVVGVAASHDEYGACYNMQYRLQRSTVENIEDMNSIFSHHMSVYFKNQGRYPDHVIYYRDGVSDGQFKIVRDNELRDIRAACSKLRVNTKITCIVVVKRHHTRFFPQTVNPRDKFNNVEPGTVVDKVIIHPKEVEFFMVSHQSIQGTAKPTRYNVVVDEAKMNIDDLQKLTYNLCHMFPRCNRVVSYPAPAYLAHLVAFRGRVYIEGARNFGDLSREYERRLVKSEFMQSNPMYFI